MANQVRFQFKKPKAFIRYNESDKFPYSAFLYSQRAVLFFIRWFQLKETLEATEDGLIEPDIDFWHMEYQVLPENDCSQSLLITKIKNLFKS